LLLQRGSVYVGFGSNGDAPPYHGWLFEYKAANLSLQSGIYNTTPNASSVPDTQGCPGWAGWLPAGGSFGCLVLAPPPIRPVFLRRLATE